MSHRKYEKPRSGNLGFLPRKRCRRGLGKVKCFPTDNVADKPHLTSFLAYKVGSSHIVRDLDRQGSKLHQKEISEQVSYVEAPPMVVVGVVGYEVTVTGIRPTTAVFSKNLDESFRRRQTRRWYISKRKAYTKWSAEDKNEEYEKTREEKLKKMLDNSTVIRVVAHTQPTLLPQLKRKKAHIAEIQVNGGSVADKIEFAKGLLEQKITVGSVFKKDQLIDVIGITKGKGFKGVISRWGVTKLPRKTHKGLRKVACIGAWHPARVSYTVARAGQKGYHHRTSRNNKVMMVGAPLNTEAGKLAGKTDYDLTEKSVNPISAFPGYGFINHEFLMIKGTIVGALKRPVTLRKSITPVTTRVAREKTKLKFIDTSSKMGTGRFQTLKEKRAFMGPLKKELEKKREEDLKRLAEERKKKEADEKKKAEEAAKKAEEEAKKEADKPKKKKKKQQKKKKRRKKKKSSDE